MVAREFSVPENILKHNAVEEEIKANDSQQRRSFLISKALPVGLCNRIISLVD